MLSQFLDKKIRAAKYKILKDGTYFGEISSLHGVWANARSLEVCREQLREVLEDWLLLKVQGGEIVAGFALKTDKRNLVRNV